MNFSDCFWSSCRHSAPTASPVKSWTTVTIDGARKDQSYPPGECFKGMQEPLFFLFSSFSPEGCRLSSIAAALLPASATSQAGEAGVEVGKALGGAPREPTASDAPLFHGLPPSHRSTATPQPTLAPSPSTDGHDAAAKVSLLTALGRWRWLICTSRPARCTQTTGTCRRQHVPLGCSRCPGVWPAPRGSTAPAAARQNRAQHRRHGPRIPSQVPGPHSPAPVPCPPPALKLTGSTRRL